MLVGATVFWCSSDADSAGSCSVSCSPTCLFRVDRAPPILTASCFANGAAAEDALAAAAQQQRGSTGAPPPQPNDGSSRGGRLSSFQLAVSIVSPLAALTLIAAAVAFWQRRRRLNNISTQFEPAKVQHEPAPLPLIQLASVAWAGEQRSLGGPLVECGDADIAVDARNAGVVFTSTWLDDSAPAIDIAMPVTIRLEPQPASRLISSPGPASVRPMAPLLPTNPVVQQATHAADRAAVLQLSMQQARRVVAESRRMAQLASVPEPHQKQ